MVVIAKELKIGDVVQMRTGQVRIAALYESHHGVEAVVCPARRADDKGARILWFYPGDSLILTRRNTNPWVPILPRPKRERRDDDSGPEEEEGEPVSEA